MPKNNESGSGRLKKNQAGTGLENAELINELAALEANPDATENAEEGLTFNYTADSVTYTFRMPNESASSINVKNPRPYVKEAGALIESAREVRQQMLFGSVDVDKLAASYPFKPYSYQIENVKTMLNRFEGNGVFGDQVGLGKTVQALMTAHAMFASGAIRNALIVVTPQTEKGWRDEIETKFPSIFSIAESEDFKRTLSRMKQDNENHQAGNRIYIVKATDLEKYFDKVSIVEQLKRYHDAVEKELSAEEEKAFENLENELSDGLLRPIWRLLNVLKSYGLKVSAMVDRDSLEKQELIDLFKEYGMWEGLSDVGNRIEWTIPNTANDSVLYGMTFAKYNRLLGVFELLENKLQSKTKSYPDAQNRLQMLTWLKEQIEKTRNRKEGYAEFYQNEEVSIFLDLFSQGSQRLIDLLIVDEVHTFYMKSKKGKKDGEQVIDEEKVASAVDLLSQINKKYCVLMSATPVRTNLENVFDLIYIADRARVGEDKSSGLAYFYNTVCQLPESVEFFHLSEMICNPVRRKNFFGMVNNFFTRKRIRDVEAVMGGRSKDSPELKELFQEGTSAYKALIENRVLMYMQTGTDTKENACASAKEAYKHWLKGCWDDEQESSIRHWYAALDVTLMAMASDESELKLAECATGERQKQRMIAESCKNRRTAHSYVDWRRRHKSGVALAIDDSVCERSPLISDEDVETVKRELKELSIALNTKALSDCETELNRGEEIKTLLFGVERAVSSDPNAGSTTEGVVALIKKLDEYGYAPANSEYLPFLRNALTMKKFIYTMCMLPEALSEACAGLKSKNSNQVQTVFADKLLMPCEGLDLWKKKNLAWDETQKMFESLSNDTVLVYVSRAKFGKNRDVRERMRQELEAKFKGERKVVVIDNRTDAAGLPAISLKSGNYHQIAIVHQGFQAGVNLQQYRTFVFAQLDFKGQRLLEPVDIEQWVGRIHRTGQVKNCRIITILKTYFASVKKNPEMEFLKWYYSILADPEGLDLYGDNTPDIAFLQPVIEDRLRWFFAKKMERKLFKSLLEGEHCARLQSKPHQKDVVGDYTLKEYSFSELLELCYVFDKKYGGNLKEVAKTLIRKLCNVEGFGGKNTALKGGGNQ